MFNPQQRQHLRTISAHLYEWAGNVEKAINSMARQTGADSHGIFPVTPTIGSVSAIAANGIFNVQIVDRFPINNPTLAARAITYFVEFATDKGFVNVVHTEVWHSARNQNVFLGNQTLFVRAYSQLQGSSPSAPVVFGGSVPTAVVGGGVAAPTQQAYQGSGTSKVSGQGHGVPLRSGQ